MSSPNHPEDILAHYLPEDSLSEVMQLLRGHDLGIRISRKRKSKLGDFRVERGKKPWISVNHDLPKDAFLITLLHEFAHYQVFTEYGRRVSPHGKEWKMEFSRLLNRFLEMDVFSKKVKHPLSKYAKNPKASSGADIELLRSLDLIPKEEEDEIYVENIDEGTEFTMPDGRVFRMLGKVRTRYRAIRIDNGKTYSFHPMLKVQPRHS